jgi:hypothetical protein
MIVLSNAVTNPWTMVIHSFNTHFTFTAVMNSGKFYIITFLTVTILDKSPDFHSKNFKSLDKINTFQVYDLIFWLFSIF